MRVFGPVVPAGEAAPVAIALGLALCLATSGCGKAPPPPAPSASGAALARGVDGPSAFARRCQGLPEAPPEVVAEASVPVVDDSRSLTELTRMYERATARHETMGLTQTRIAYATTLAAAGIREGEGAVCMRVQVRVTMAMAPMTVFIAREVAGDACRRAAVLDHEMQHVAIHATFLRDAPARLAARMTAADVGRVRHATDPEALQQDAAREVGSIVAEAEAADRAALSVLQASLDTPAEYARLGTLCDTARVAVPTDGVRAQSDRR